MPAINISSLFNQAYNQQNWLLFLSQTFVKTDFYLSPETVPDFDNNIASQVLKLGYITLIENGIERSIAVYEVTLAKGVILERNRVGLRNLLLKYWRNIDAAFITFHHVGSSQWRFTYVSELTGYNAEGDFIKIATEPKRYTYVLGENESVRTAAERFTILAAKSSNSTLADVKDAFSVEKLSKAFFDEYKKQYDAFNQYILSQPTYRSTFFNGDEKAIRDFNKKLLGRIVFLYFIQKKGWLGVPLNDKWGKGNFNFLTQAFTNAQNPELFYSGFLSVLFFDTLNQSRPNDIFLLENTRIPYLNGGLFEEENPNLRLLNFPHSLFENLFNFFNQYNFTIYEDDPNDHTVAVDPEMLGHIFENLLEDNKDKGAFYTPKEIVHYMCQESLIEYLATYFENKGYEVVKENFDNIGLDNPDKPSLFSANTARKGQMVLETHTSNPTPAITNKIDRTLIEKLLKKTLTDQDKKFVKDHSEEINTALDQVKICDPAIGSGAFPMGLLNEIFTAKQTLHTFKHGNTTTFNASEVKLNIIQNSIYGVDIEKGAVDIARLRFWLSLIVDEDSPKPLPNLDYKIVVGNSLVSKFGDDIIDIDWSINDTKDGLFGAPYAAQKTKLLQQISTTQKQYFNPTSDKKTLAAEIRNLKIDLLINQLQLMIKTKGIETQPTGRGKDLAKQTELYLQTLGWIASITKLETLKNTTDKPLHFFDWKLDFPEVMNEQVNPSVGFDIVIANPPYVSIRTTNFEKSYKHFFKSKYQLAVGQYDLYVLFIEKSHELLVSKGIMSFIIPKRMLSNESFQEARLFVLDNISIFRYVDAEMPFDTANVEANIMFGKKSVKSNQVESIFFDSKDLLFKRKTIVDSNFIRKMPFSIFPFIYVDSTLKLLFKIQDKEYPQLSNHVDITRGFECGYNDAAIDNIESRYKLLKADSIGSYILKNHNFIYCNPDFSNSSKYKTSALFENCPKLLTKFVASKMEFALDEIGYCSTNSVYNIHLRTNSILSYNYLLGVLNSKFATFWFNTAFLNNDALFPHIQKNQLDAIPINFDKKAAKKLNMLVSKLIPLKTQSINTISLEQEIDNLVYKLYELNYEEVKLIDPHFGLSEEEYEAISLE